MSENEKRIMNENLSEYEMQMVEMAFAYFDNDDNQGDIISDLIMRNIIETKTQEVK